MGKRKLTSADIARAAGLSKQAIHQSKHVQKAADGSIDVEATISGIDALSEAQLRKERALAEKHEMENQVRSGELIQVEEARRMGAIAAQAVRDGLLGIPDRVAPEIASLTDARQVRDRLKEEIGLVLKALPAEIFTKARAETRQDQPPA